MTEEEIKKEYEAWFTIGDMDKIWFKCELYSIQYVDADVIFK